jgi:hypothetical protein
MFQNLLIQLALDFTKKALSDPETQHRIQDGAGQAADLLQVMTGNVNQRTERESLELALEKCIRKDPESQMKVTAFITSLYLQHPIQRGAQVGGSLLKHFGRSWFPHVAERELKYSLIVDSELLDYIYSELNKTHMRN